MRCGLYLGCKSQPLMKRHSGVLRVVPGGRGAKAQQPVYDQFLAMGGDPRFLEFAAEQARSRFGYLDVARLAPGTVQGLLDDLSHAKCKVDRLLDLFPHPTKRESQLLSRGADTVKDRSDLPHVRRIALRPFLVASVMARDLDESWAKAMSWQRYEHRERLPDQERVYWLSVLAPYTALLAGEPKWSWITRWFKLRFGVDRESSLYFFWRDHQKRILSTKSDMDRHMQSLALLAPATVFLDWLERQKNIATGLRRMLGEQYVGCIFENFSALDPTLRLTLENILVLGVGEVCGPPADSRLS